MIALIRALVTSALVLLGLCGLAWLVLFVLVFLVR